jgi:hypothetical protein
MLSLTLSRTTSLVFGIPADVTEVVIANVCALPLLLTPETVMRPVLLYDGDLLELADFNVSVVWNTKPVVTPVTLAALMTQKRAARQHA